MGVHLLSRIFCIKIHRSEVEKTTSQKYAYFKPYVIFPRCSFLHPLTSLKLGCVWQLIIFSSGCFGAACSCVIGRMQSWSSLPVAWLGRRNPWPLHALSHLKKEHESFNKEFSLSLVRASVSIRICTMLLAAWRKISRATVVATSNKKPLSTWKSMLCGKHIDNSEPEGESGLLYSLLFACEEYMLKSLCLNKCKRTYKEAIKGYK